MPTNARRDVTHLFPAPDIQRFRAAANRNRFASRGPSLPVRTAVRVAWSIAAWLCAIAAVGAFAAFPRVAVADEGADVLEFHVMTPVTGPYVGTANPIRGVNGGGFPWVVKRARGHLQANGELEIRVRGLVLAADPSVPVDLQLTNPVAHFRALVSCLSIDASGQPVTVNAATDQFPATPKGDSEIEATVPLPTPCIAPIVFVTSPTGAWFAATGN